MDIVFNSKIAPVLKIISECQNPRDGEANSLVERILCSRKPENPYLPQSTHF